MGEENLEGLWQKTEGGHSVVPAVFGASLREWHGDNRPVGVQRTGVTTPHHEQSQAGQRCAQAPRDTPSLFCSLHVACPGAASSRPALHKPRSTQRPWQGTALGINPVVLVHCR